MKKDSKKNMKKLPTRIVVKKAMRKTLNKRKRNKPVVEQELQEKKDDINEI